MRKIFVLLVVSMVIGILSVVIGCAGKGEKMGEKEAAVSAEAKSGMPKERKTYVSKAGFSVSYPADWYLNEDRGAGWRIGPEGPAFTIANKDPYYYIPQSDNNVEVSFGDFNDLSGSPSEIEKKLKYSVENFGMLTVERINFIKKRNITFCLAYGQPRGHTEKHQNLFFYLPKSKRIESIIVYSLGRYSIEVLLDIIIIQVSD